MSDRLDLRGRELSAVPGAVWQAPGLRSLALGRNPLGTIPDAIGELSELTALYLDETAIVALPDWLAELPALQRLDVRWNGFVDPPAVVERLRARGCVVWL